MNIPAPISGGLILSYKCPAECRHCMYGCSPKWTGDWITVGQLEKSLPQLAKVIRPSPYGRQHMSLNHGLHFTGGEPFLNRISEPIPSGLPRGGFNFALDRGYGETREGYVSKCHLCLDIRKYLASTGEFEELKPRQFYEQLQ